MMIQPPAGTLVTVDWGISTMGNPYIHLHPRMAGMPAWMLTLNPAEAALLAEALRQALLEVEARREGQGAGEGR